MLTIITHSSTFYQKLAQAYFQTQGIATQLYDGNLDANTTAILIIDPCQIGGEWLHVGEFWRKYLLGTQPAVKLLIAGFEEMQNTNQLDLLKLPTDFLSYLTQALPTSDLGEIQTSGMSLAGKFRKFLDGHGEESLLKLITQLRSSFDTALFMLDDGSDFEEAWESMLKVVGEMIGKQLVERWEKYKPYFKPTPFYRQLQAYDVSMFERLIDFFTENPNEPTVRDLTPQLTALSQYLREIDEVLS
ncbi:MAG: hypothetical protein ACPGJS_03990 [Flammeovirgaceae bacterium]